MPTPITTNTLFYGDNTGVGAGWRERVAGAP
jgi:hypothetical protein